jgi:hypothetical protein
MLQMDDDPVAHLAIAFESAGWTSPHAFPIMVMQTLLGSWDRTSTAGKNGASKLAQVRTTPHTRTTPPTPINSDQTCVCD